MMLIPVVAFGVIVSGTVTRSIKLSRIQRRMNERIAALSDSFCLIPETE